MILVFDAAEIIGAEVTRLLSDEDYAVRAVVRDLNHHLAKATALLSPRVELAEFSPANVDKLFRGVTKVFLSTSESPAMVAEQGVFIQAAAKAGVKQVIRVSSLGVNNTSNTGPAYWHSLLDGQLLATGLNWILLQPAIQMQELLPLAAYIKEKAILYSQFGETSFPFVDARDIANCAFQLFNTHAPQTGLKCIIKGPQTLSFSDLTTRLSQIIARQLSCVQLTPAEYQILLTQTGHPAWYAEQQQQVGLASALLNNFEISLASLPGAVLKAQSIVFEDFAKHYVPVLAGKLDEETMLPDEPLANLVEKSGVAADEYWELVPVRED